MITCTVSLDVIFASINSVIPNTLPYREATKEIRNNNVPVVVLGVVLVIVLVVVLLVVLVVVVVVVPQSRKQQ